MHLMLSLLVFGCFATSALPSAETNEVRHVALVFNGGPVPSHAERYLALFAAEGIHATFAYHGERAREHADTARAVLAAGHEIVNHSLSGAHPRELDDAALAREVVGAQTVLQDILGVAPRWYWPPFEEWDPRLPDLFARAQIRFFPMLPIRSSDDSNLAHVGDTIRLRATLRPVDHSVIVFHEWREESLAQMPAILTALKQRGCVFLTFSELQSHHANRVLAAWRNNRYAGEIDVHPTVYTALDDTTVEALLPELWKWIPLRSLLEQHDDQSWRDFQEEQDWVPFLNALPDAHPVKLHWWRGREAERILLDFASRGWIRDQRIIPILIAGLSNPAPRTEGSFAVLNELTGCYRLWQAPGTVPEQERLADWYRAWRKSTEGKQVVLTPEWKARLQREFVTTCDLVTQSARDPRHNLYGFQTPTALGLLQDTGPLYGYTWDGPSIFGGMLPGQRNGNGFVHVCVRSRTPLAQRIAIWETPYPWDRTPEIQQSATLVWSKLLAGTDWVVEVYTKRVTPREQARLKRALQKGAGRK